MICYYKGYTIIKTTGKDEYKIKEIDDIITDTIKDIKAIIDDINKAKLSLV